VEETLRAFGHIDILFNNAGIVTSGTAETTTEEDWARTMDINVTAVWRMSRLVVPEMARCAFTKGFLWADMSLTGEDNPDTYQLAHHTGAKIYKRYRFYIKKLPRLL
jgi:NAD(P)-dependent dehydrogenase (short-subunit alcohol dehydrogenase family)